ncbi:MAG: EamA family transporter [Pseudomonadota bacterium]
MMPVQSPVTPGAINWIRLIVIAMIWGGAFMGVKIALDGFSPLQLAATRVGIGALVLRGLMRWRGVTFPSFANKRLWGFIVVIAFLSTALPFAMLSWGQQHVPSAFAGMSMAAVPLFILPLAHIFVPGEQMHTRKVAGFLIGFIGTMILIGTGGLQAAETWTVQLAQCACVAAALCYACNSIMTKRCPPVNELALSTAALSLAFVMLAPAALIVEGVPDLAAIPQNAWIAMVYLALLPTAAAYLLKVAVVRSAGPSFMSLVNYQVPVWSVILGAVFLAERLPSTLFFALALILAGLAISQWGTLKGLFARAKT